MKSRKFIVFLILMLSADPSGYGQGADGYDIVWTSQSKNSSESMPLVGGDMGCNVWVEANELMIYVQRSGSFTENGEYVKMGRIRVRLEPDLIQKFDDFEQRLELNKGTIRITANDNGEKHIEILLWIDVFTSTLHIEIESENELTAHASYESWRYEDQEIPAGSSKARFGIFSLEGYPEKVIASKDSIAFIGKGVRFFHRNPARSLIPSVLIEQQGLEKYEDQIIDDISDRTFGGILGGQGWKSTGIRSGDYQGTPYRSWNLSTVRASKRHHLMLVSHIEQTETLATWEQALDNKWSSVNSELSNAHAGSLEWWQKFWSRSWIRLGSLEEENDQWKMGRNYQLFRYQLGGNVFGEYPTKFNGGNLTFDPGLVDTKRSFDPNWRAWGGAIFTAQNQRLLYWPLLKSGDFDVIQPQFELYRKALGGAEARVRANFDHDGAMFSEYISVPGIAFGSGYGWQYGDHRQRGEEIEFGDERATADRGYNDLVEKGVMANQSVSYHWESQVEHAYMILQYHFYSGAPIYKYIPFIRSSLVFFDQHYQRREKIRNGKSLDEEGRLVFYPSTSCESYRGAKNPVDLIAGIRACLEMINKLDNSYFKEDEKAYFLSYLERLPDYNYSEVDGDKILLPAASWKSYKNVECPQFYPLFPFDRFALIDEEIQTFKNTWKHGSFPKDMVISWHQDGIFYARMGMVKEAASYNMKKLKDAPRRFPTFWGPGHDWVPDHNWGGSGMIGLQEMLMQCFDEKILLFPAWPKDWDVHFKLHAPDNTTVEGELKDGQLVRLLVSPEERRSDIQFMNQGIKLN